MSSWGLPSWEDEFDVDYSSLPGSKDNKYKRIQVRTNDGGVREVILGGPKPTIAPDDSFGNPEDEIFRRAGEGAVEGIKWVMDGSILKPVSDALRNDKVKAAARALVPGFSGAEAVTGAISGAGALVGAGWDQDLKDVPNLPDIVQKEAGEGIHAGIEAVAPIDVATLGAGSAAALAAKTGFKGAGALAKLAKVADLTEGAYGAGQLGYGLGSEDYATAGIGLARLAGGAGSLAPHVKESFTAADEALAGVAPHVEKLARDLGYTDPQLSFGGSFMARPKGVRSVFPDDVAELIGESREASRPGTNVALERIDNVVQEAVKRTRDRMAEISSDESLKDLKVEMRIGESTQFDPETRTIYYDPYEIAGHADTPEKFALAIRDVLRHEPGHGAGVHDVPTFEGKTDKVADLIEGDEFDLTPEGLVNELDNAGYTGNLDASKVPFSPGLTHTPDVDVPADWMPHTRANMFKRAGVSPTESNFIGAYDRYSHDPDINSVHDTLVKTLSDPEIYAAFARQSPTPKPNGPMGNRMVDAPSRFNSPEEEAASLTEIMNSDRPMDERLAARARLDEIMNPELPSEAELARSMEEFPAALAEEGLPVDPNLLKAPETVRQPNVSQPSERVPGDIGPVRPISEVIADMNRQVMGATGGPTPKPTEPVKVTKVETPVTEVRNLNDVIDTMFGKGTRVKAAQVREAKAVYEKLLKESGGNTPTTAQLDKALGKGGSVQPDAIPTKPTESIPSESPVAEKPPAVEDAPPVKKGPPEHKKLSDMTPEELEAEALAAENKTIDGKPAPQFETAATMRRLAEQKRSAAARQQQIEANRALAAEQTKAIPEPPKRTAGPVEPVATNPLESKIPKATRPKRVNPVKVLTGEVPEPVSPVKKGKTQKAQADVDTTAQKVEAETGASTNNPPELSTPQGKKFVKSVAKTMGITEEKAASLVSQPPQNVPSTVQPPTGTVGGGPKGKTPKPSTKTVQGAGKTVQSGNAGGSQGTPPAPPTQTPQAPRLPKPKGKRPQFNFLEWVRQRRAGDITETQAKRRWSSLPKGVQAQLDFEAGTLKLPEVRKRLDSIHRKMRQAGIDVGYVENYLTHLWKESPAQVRQVLGKRLGLKPGIAMTRSIPTLAEGITKGLTPKFENMGDVLAWYERASEKAMADRGFFEWLRGQKLIKPAGKAPHDWVTLNPDRFPIRKWKGNTVQFKAPADMATKINEYLYDINSDPHTFIKGLHTAASFSSFLKNIRLAAGVPFTKLNMHSFSVLAHHVLTTPTIKGVVPNIPRMIGRGLKGFGEMLDPRLHKWTDKELSRARFFTENSALTLSTEDHVFAPELRGTLKERLKASKSVPEAFRTVIDRMFEEPLFQNHLPKMKLNTADTLYKEYRKQGMGRREAAQAAGEVTNNLYGGLNLDEMGRSKIGQDMARLLVLAPDWLESNLRTTKEIVGSPLGRTPKQKTYRDFAVNLLGTYVAGTMLQKALTGQWMHENNPGQQFSIYLGKNPETGKDRYIKPYGAGLAGIRIIYDTAEATARREDIGKATDVVRGRLSIPAGVAGSVLFNKGPFGQPVYKRGDTALGQVKDVGSMIGSQTIPQYVLGPVSGMQGKVSPEMALAQTMEFPYTEVEHRNPDDKKTTTSKRSRRRRRR